MLSVLLFIVFIVVFIATSVVVANLVDLRKKSGFAGQLAAGLLSVVLLFILPFVLTGRIDLRSLIVLLIISVISASIGYLLQLFLGLQRYPVEATTAFASAEMVTKNPLFILLFYCSLLVSLAYVIAAGYYNFIYSGDTKYLHVLKATMLWTIVQGITFALPMVAGILSSKNIDENLRSLIFVRQTVNLIPTAAFVSIALPALGVNSAYDIVILGYKVPIIASISVILIFLTVVILPYVLGVTGAAGYSETIHEREIKSLEKYRNEIFGTSPHTLEPVIQKFIEYDNTEIENLIEANPLIAGLVSPDHIPDVFQDLLKSLNIEALWTLDARAKYLSHLIDVREKSEKHIEQLHRCESAAEVQAKANSIALEIGAWIDEVKADAAIGRGRPIVFMLISSLAFSATGILLSSIGGMLWSSFVQIQHS